MNKELYVSSTPHETKVALVEDDQLAEVFFERENEYTLAGSIYKGRVTRVLPGMQSAFVNIGLERDAFLYVSDFLELADEEEDEEFGEIPAPRGAIDLSKAQPTQESPAAEPQAASADCSGRRGRRPRSYFRGGSARCDGRGRRCFEWSGFRRRGAPLAWTPSPWRPSRPF